MNITDIRVYLRKGDQSLKAFANLTLDGSFAVRNLKIVDGQKGLFVSMPSRKLPSGKYQDVAHPVTREMRDLIQAQVLEAYRRAAGVQTGSDSTG